MKLCSCRSSVVVVAFLVAVGASGPPLARGLAQEAAPVAPLQPAPVVDAFGEPLPAGAVDRLGFAHGPHYARSYPRPRAAFSQDSRYLATLSAGQVLLWETATGKLTRRLPLGLRGQALAFSSATSLEVVEETAVDRFVLCSWDVATGQRKRTTPLRFSASFGGLAFAADGRLLALSTLPGPDVTVLETATGKIVRRLHDYADHVLAFTSDGKSLLIASDYNQQQDRPQRLRILDLASGQVTVQPLPHGAALLAGACGTGPLNLAYTFYQDGAHQSFVAAVSPQTGKELARFATYKDKDVWSLALSPDGKTLAVGERNAVFLREPSTGRILRRLFPDVATDSTGSLAFSPNGKYLALGGEDGAVRLWQLPGGKAQDLTPGHSGRVFALGFSPDGKWLASRSSDNTIRVWDWRQRREVHRFPTKTPFWHYSDDQKLVFSPDGRFLFEEERGETTFWDLKTSTKLILPLNQQLQAHIVATDGKTITVSPRPGSPNWFEPVDAATRAKADALSRQAQDKNPQLRPYRLVCTHAPLRLSTDGSLLLEKYQVRDDTQVMRTAYLHRGFRLVATADGKILNQLSLPHPWRDMLEFSPDGKRIALLLEKGRLEIYETRTGQKRIDWPMNRHTDAFLFSADGRFLLAADRVGGIGIWDCRTGQRVSALPGTPETAVSLALSPDGKVLASGGNDGAILVWDLTRFLPRKGPVAAPGDRHLDECWQDLAVDNAAKAFQAIGRLVDGGDRTVAFLKAKVLDPARDKRIVQSLSQLDAKRFAIREKALVDLQQVGEPAAPLIHAAMKGPITLEKQLRLQKLLDSFDPPFASPGGLRLLRCLEVLETIGTPAARDLLRKLTNGPESDPLAREARQALARLEKTGKR